MMAHRYPHRLLILMVLIAGLLPFQTTHSQGDNQHPRLYFTTQELDTLRQQAATTHNAMWLVIKTYVDGEQDTSPKTSPPNKNLDTFRNAGNQLMVFGFACAIDDTYCPLARDYLLAYVQWEQWDIPDHRDLGHAHLLLGSALAYDWTYTHLSESERATVRTHLGDRAEQMYEASTAQDYVEEWHNWWPKSYMQNHCGTNYSGMGMAGLALKGEDDRAQKWIDRAAEQIGNIQLLQEGIGDGTWHEGIAYQSYAHTMTLPFMLNLRRLEGQDTLPHTFMRNFASWRVYNYLPNTVAYIMAFGNFEWSWGDGRSLHILRYSAAEYQDGYAQWLANELAKLDGRDSFIWNAPWCVLEFLHYDATVDPVSPEGKRKGARTFPDLEGVIWRTGWQQDDLVFALKSGPFGGRYAYDTFTQGKPPWEPPCDENDCSLNIGHDHDDTNTFYLYRNGEWLAPETVTYGPTDTSYHNTLLVDGQGQFHPAAKYYDTYPEGETGGNAALEITASTSTMDYVASDASPRYAYIDGMGDVTRHVLFVRPSYFVVVDHIESSTDHTYTWVSHASDSITLGDPWIQAKTAEGQVLGIGVAAPAPFEATKANDGLPLVQVSPTSQIGNMRFVMLLYPTDEAGWADRPTFSLLDEDTSTTVALRVERDTATEDTLVRVDGGTGSYSVGSYTSDARAVVVARDSAGTLTRVVVAGGTIVTDQQQAQTLAANLEATIPFEAAFSGTTLTINSEYADHATGVTLYAPNVETVMVGETEYPFTRSGDTITMGEHTQEWEWLYLPMVQR